MNDLTKGSPLKQIVLFSIPLIIGNVFQLLYTTADTLIVGRTLGVQALGGIGAAGSVMFLILGFSQGFAAGLAIPVAQAYGARDYHKIRRSVLIGWVLIILVSVVLTVISVATLEDLLRFMNTPDDIFQYTYDYLIVVFTYMIVTVFFNLLSNMIRSMGDSRTPLYFLIVAAVINIVLDYVLILYTDMGIKGAAVATMISQGVAVFLCLLSIFKRWRILRPHFEFSQMRKDEVVYHSKIAFPMAIQSSIIAIGSVAVAISLNGLGSTAVATYSAAQKADEIVILVLMSFGLAMATYVGQNYGAKKYQRIIDGVRSISKVSIAFSIIAGVILILYGNGIVRIFAGSDVTQEMLTYGRQYFIVVTPFYAFLALLFIYRNTLQGLGDSKVPTYAGVMELVMRVIAAFVLGDLFGFYGLAISSPLAWIGALIPLAYSYRHRKNYLDRLWAYQLDS